MPRWVGWLNSVVFGGGALKRTGLGKNKHDISKRMLLCDKLLPSNLHAIAEAE